MHSCILVITFEQLSRIQAAFEKQSKDSDGIRSAFLHLGRDIRPAFEPHSSRIAFERQSKDSGVIRSAFQLDSLSTKKIETDLGGIRDATLHSGRDIWTAFEPH